MAIQKEIWERSIVEHLFADIKNINITAVAVLRDQSFYYRGRHISGADESDFFHRKQPFFQNCKTN